MEISQKYAPENIDFYEGQLKRIDLTPDVRLDYYNKIDEAQNFTFKELTTLITRIGEDTKLCICGDFMQSDINGKTGFKEMFDIFSDDESRSNGINCFSFTTDDIVRSKILKFIISKLEKGKKV